MSTMGPTPIPINWTAVANLAKKLYRFQQIANILGISYDTLYRRCIEEQGVTFREFWYRHADYTCGQLQDLILDECFQHRKEYAVQLLAKHFLKMDRPYDAEAGMESVLEDGKKPFELTFNNGGIIELVKTDDDSFFKSYYDQEAMKRAAESQAINNFNAVAASGN